jgi:CDP-6-deoxy-D-xylo-4-hexulose-3-dehydrase
VRQPAYSESQYRVVGSLSQTDYVMNQVFWIGLYPGISSVVLEYMLETLRGAASLAAPVGV